MEFDFSFAGGPARAPKGRGDDSSFRLLLIGDFSGRAAQRASGVLPPPLTRPREVDAGNLDGAVEQRLVGFPVGPAGAEEMVTFRSLDDFHPDALFRRLALFETPRTLRVRLSAPDPDETTFAAAEAWLAQRNGPAAAAPSPSVDPPIEHVGESTASTVERLLGRQSTPRAPSPEEGTSATVRAIIDAAVRPHVKKDTGPRRGLLLAALDEALTADMRAILAAPLFRAVEGAWRGAERIVRALDTDAELRVALFDACKDDLIGALGVAGADLETSDLHRLLVGDGQRRWSVIAIHDAFEPTIEDLRLVAALGAIASRTHAPFVGGAAPALLGCRTVADAADPATWTNTADTAAAGPFWQALRESPLAPFIGLALPRVLARLPYGRKTDPIESFAFEELPPRDAGEAEHRLWSGAGFAVAQVYGAAFRAGGWPLDVGAAAEIDDLPAHSFVDDDGESRLVPCTEVGLGERAGAAVLARGVIPLFARRDRGTVRLVDLPSIASPPLALAVPAADVAD